MSSLIVLVKHNQISLNLRLFQYIQPCTYNYIIKIMGNKNTSADQKIIYNEELFPIEGEKVQTLLHRSIGAITFLNKYKQRLIGSGVAISNNLVLTAAHNVFCRDQGYEYHNFKVFFGVNGIAKNYYEVQTIRFLDQYKTCAQSKKSFYDFALLKLKKELQYNEFLEISLGCPACLMDKNEQTSIQIFGFPGRYKNNYWPLDEQYKEFQLRQFGLSLKNRMVSVDSSLQRMCYGISTLSGQSGCPVVIDKKIIGIHIGGGKEYEPFNIGRLMDVQFLSKINQWCMELTNHSIQIKSEDSCSHLQSTIKDYLKDIQQRKKMSVQSQLNLKDKKLKVISLKEYTSLEVLHLSNNQLSAINLTNNPRLTQLHINSNRLTQVNLIKNINLVHLSLNNNRINAVDLTKNVFLKKLNLSDNQLSVINLTNNIDLTYLFVQNNNLSAIDVTHNTQLIKLNVSDNGLSQIDVSRNKKLTRLSLRRNQISVINLTENKKLTYLSMDNNRLQQVYLSFSQRSAHYFLSSFIFSDQLSAVCQIHIWHNSMDSKQCNNLRQSWIKKKYWPNMGFFSFLGSNFNKHGCKYVFTAIEQDQKQQQVEELSPSINNEH